MAWDISFTSVKMKLLQKTLRTYLLLSVIIFSISVPVFYFLVQKLWIDDVDDSLVYQKEKIVNGINKYQLNADSLKNFIAIASRLDIDILITPLTANPAAGDSIYYKSYYDPVRKHVEPFRELKSVIYANNKPYAVFIQKDLVESKDLIWGIVFTQALLFLFLFSAILLLQSWLSKKLWSPFYYVISQLKTFKIDRDEPFREEKSTITEFNELNDSVKRLAENNRLIFRAQKEFTENAAHETQTPLSVIKSQLDLFAQEENLSEAQSEIITCIDRNLRLLTKLNRNLLLLSKLENQQYALSDTIELSAVIGEIVTNFEEQIDLKGLSIKLILKDNPVITSNSFLLHSLFTNLITNAIKYNIESGNIEIILTKDFFEIVNTGADSQLPESRIFERFFKITDTHENSGLGLAIVKKICETLNFSIRYEFTAGNLHSFKIKFDNN